MVAPRRVQQQHFGNCVPPFVGAVEQQLANRFRAGRAPGSRVRSAGIPLRSNVATRASTWVDFPAPSPPSTVIKRPRRLAACLSRCPARSVPASPDHVPGDGRDPSERTHALDIGSGDKRRFDRLHIRDRDDDLAERLALLDRRRNRLIVSEDNLHVLARLARHGHDEILRAFAVDDVADAAENAAELFGLYGVESPTKQALQLSGLLVQAAEHLALLLTGLKGMHGSSDEILRIKEIEDEADDVARAARASLFKDDRIDPVVVIRWKDIYEALEEAVDACETAAHRVGNILVKNA